jgi:hypothetical protein
VISTLVAGIPELVENGVCGILVPAGSVDELERALLTALNWTESQLTEMGRAGAERVAMRHNAAVEAGRLAELFGIATPAANIAGELGKRTEADKNRSRLTGSGVAASVLCLLLTLALAILQNCA